MNALAKREPDYRQPALSFVEGKATRKVYLYELHSFLIPFLVRQGIDPRRDWRELSQVTPQMMSDYWQEINDSPLAKTTKNFHLTFCRRYFKQALIAGIIPLNPTIVLRNFRREKAMAPREVPIETVKHVLEVYKKDRSLRGLRNYAMFRLTATLGLRRAEICDLKTKDVTDKWVTVWGKGGKRRDIGLRDDFNIQSGLNRWRTASGVKDGYLFRRISNVTGITEEKVQPDTFYRIMRQKLRLIGVEGIHPHDLRHTAITWAARKGVPIREIQYDMGHESITTTEGYDSSRFERRVQVARVMDELLGPDA